MRGMADSRLTRLSEHLYCFADICNVYVIVDGGAALLIDCGSGAVAEALADTGVSAVEWVLHTHHHRDQCAGAPALAAAGAKVAAPEHERHLFEDAELFWRTRRVYDNYDDRNTFFTAARDIAVDAALQDYETFVWRGYRFEIVPAKGHTRGSSMLITAVDGQRVAFTGDLMNAGGTLYQLHAMEYAYGGMEGIAFTIESIDALARLGARTAYPSHGAPIVDVAGDVARLRRRLADCVALGNGMRVAGSAAGSDLPPAHFLPEARLQRHHGARCWALSEVAQVLADPAAWASTPCAYPRPIRIDRRLRDGERFEWEEYRFDIYHAPGQTEFHSVYAGPIDGRRVAFTGDNFFVADTLRAGAAITRPYQTTVMRNSFQLGMHRRCAEVMRRIDPELICPGHRDVIDCSKQQLDEYADFIARKERVFRNLVAEPADHYVDLFWARLLPYLATVEPGGAVEYRLLLRNNLERDADYTAAIEPPPGWRAGAAASVRLRAGERGEVRLRATAPDAGDGVRRLTTARISVDGTPHGPIAEALVTVTGRRRR